MDQAGTEVQEAQQVCEEQRRGSFVLRWLAWFGAFVAFYVLSIGPAAKLCAGLHIPGKYPRTEKVLEGIYAPLSTLVEHYPPAGRFLVWYVRDIWRVPPA